MASGAVSGQVDLKLGQCMLLWPTLPLYIRAHFRLRMYEKLITSFCERRRSLFHFWKLAYPITTVCPIGLAERTDGDP